MEGCKYCTSNEPETSLGEWLFDEVVTEEGDLKGCIVGMVICPNRKHIECNVVNADRVGDTVLLLPINYCPMCGRKM